jgi:hypothetical protein
MDLCFAILQGVSTALSLVAASQVVVVVAPSRVVASSSGQGLHCKCLM